MIIDSHTHLYSESFQEDIDDVIARAKAAGVGATILPNVDVESIDRMFRLSDRYPEFCFPTVGLHPTSVKEDYKEQLNILRGYLDREQDRVVAIGEIGVDLYWDKTFISEQQEALSTQIEWSLEFGLPIIIHVRDAINELIEVLSCYKGVDRLSGVFHSFTGSKEDAEKLMEYDNFMFGINGVVTFKNSNLSEALKYIPLERILLETDSPYLAPTPYRGKRNETAYIVNISDKLSDIYQRYEHEIIEKTTINAIKLFYKLRKCF